VKNSSCSIRKCLFGSSSQNVIKPVGQTKDQVVGIISHHLEVRPGGGTSLYTLYSYVPPDRVGCLRCSVLK